MAVEELKGPEYAVAHNDETHCVSFQGTIRLQTAEDYLAISQLLQKALAAAGEAGKLSLDFRGLQVLNSSGINTISKFVITARKAERVGLLVLGNQDIYWQQKSLINLQKLWPKVGIEIK